MIISNIPNLSSMSMVRAKVDLYDGSTLLKTCTCGDVLSDFTVTREGDNSKFFGFGIVHRLDMNLIDIEREIAVTKGNTAEIGLGDGGEIWDAPYPTFYISEIKRDEKSNTITGTAYDRLYWASEYLFSDLGLEAPYTLRDVTQAIATKLGLNLRIDPTCYENFSLIYSEGANLDGTEDLRLVLNAIAEVTQTIYFLSYDGFLSFKRLDKDGEAAYSITKDDYYELNTKTPRTLSLICNTTELGENIAVELETSGSVQYIRDNPFLELRPDVSTILEKALADVGGFTITQFDCDWVGNYLLEIGDKLALTTEDDEIVYSYLLSDTVTYAGTLNETSEWEFTDQQPETYANPTNIGERINQTFAKVDKLKKEISLVAGTVEDANSELAELKLTTDSIGLRVEEVIANGANNVTEEKLDALGKEIDNLIKEVNLKITSEDLTIAVTNTLNNGVEKVVTAAKKYTFDDTGLNIGSAENEISTVISEDGMRINRANQEVLVADNTGVKAEDLHATTYLIIGENSRLEDWQGKYTACFWIGG